jgi:putative peptide zinc metalloprotease protein
MNLSEALDAALPEIPRTRLSRSRPPMVDPNLIVREDVMDGEPIVAVLCRDNSNFFRLPPGQWDLVQLFDGVRSYEEIAELHAEQSGESFSAEELRAFAEGMGEFDFWYKSPQEKNLAMSERLMAQRSRRAQRTSKISLAHISFSGWDPDRYLTGLDKIAGRLIYSRWSLVGVLLLFAFETFVFIAHWNVIGPDIPLYYNFSNKTFADFAEFWILLFILGFIHETAHGLTCKHYGGEVHSMGLMFLYLTPAFFVDVTETWISATRIQRLATIIAGIWIEMVVCGLAMLVWTNTAPGLWLHDLMYKVILITGVAVVVMNLNPLLKLDGYYFLTELIGIPDLKETSTAFVSGWVQRKILRIPVEVPVIPRRRLLLFVLYALISGAYSYLILFAVIRFSYNVTSKLFAEFALIPAGVLAFLMFRSRLKSLRALAARLWEQISADGLRKRPWLLLVAIAVIALLFVPLWRDRENGWFVVEPLKPATLHAPVDGWVESVLVREGEIVRAGQPMLRMMSTQAAAMQSHAQAATGEAHFHAFEAELRGQSIGGAAADEQGAVEMQRQSSLVVNAPVDGVVLTDDPGALEHRVVASGQPLLDMAADGPRVVRIFIPVSALSHIPANAEVALLPPGRLSVIRERLGPIDGEAVTLPAGLIAHQEYKGVELPLFYCARIPMPANVGALSLGTAGSAKIFGQRRSLFGRSVIVLMNLFRAHVW